VQLPPVLSVLSHRRREPKACRCGHWRQAHEHYRSGTDCSLCPCPRFRAAGRSAKPPARESGSRDSSSDSRLVA
jgi:hypothetical protein